ncbi:SCP2 sterol-binding domain-containing protein [Ferroacidibacillus organovorans]|uniref:SCP2 domain-containing protein n=1 Tax=Ferroacidibacillus organovorans TaxID=1765683 RepID=A0A162SRX0_9BACL|nr:SCP2 sterol-binding domain-containing protein [Ferroacidibacillus organovorans]KYP80093.1 hypothetical protein AYJ22_12400 [Ferroacidibacillus organovorans]OAG93124.1 hypothetical protein AYW79_12270 [Ferroacidibacillus organovorans]OPG15559.1 hypothetical protein B2M26_10810 [Ferroacidibacillus organovorans]
METIDARTIFAGMKTQFDPSAAKGVNAKIVYELSGHDASSWTLSVQDGALDVCEGRDDGRVQAIVRMSSDDFVKVAMGKANPMTLFMTGKLKIEGDPFLAQKFQSFFKKPDNI